jgi:TfoX/Sxy family transcriptional regulator of competence genes
MAEPYLKDLKSILAGADLSTADAQHILCKHFFSGAAAYSGGKIFMTLTPIGLALKLPDQECRDHFKRGCKPLRYFPRSPVKKNYVLLPMPHQFEKSELNQMIAHSIDFVAS